LEFFWKNKMSKYILKTGKEILDDYFKELAKNQDIDQDLRLALTDLWEQNKLYTRTHVVHVLDLLREKKSK